MVVAKFTLLGLVVGGFPLLADASGSDIMHAVEPLIQAGAVGAILAFFLVKLEPRLRGIEVAVYTLIRSNMLTLMASESPQVTKAMKNSASEIIEECKNRAPEVK